MKSDYAAYDYYDEISEVIICNYKAYMWTGFVSSNNPSYFNPYCMQLYGGGKAT